MDEDAFFDVDQLLREKGLLPESAATEDVLNENEAHQLVRKRKPELNLDKRRMIVNTLLMAKNEGILPRETQSRLASNIGVHRSTISRIFSDAKDQRSRGSEIDVRTKKIGKVGPKPTVYTDEWVQSVPLHLRTTERSFAGYLKVSHITIHRLKKAGKLRSHTSNNHPGLSESHKIARLKWVLAHIVPATLHSQAYVEPMNNVIHIDEKWFYLNPEMRKFYLLPTEDDPYRCCQSKRFKIKATFIGVISRPLYDEMGNMIHDGKYGIFAFVYKHKALKSSKNRKSGTLETKAIQNIEQQVISSMLIQKVIPAIINKWPAEMSRDIVIQWGNVRPHKIPIDDEFVQAVTGQGVNIQMVFQPPQSPDVNVLDLGLFRAIQSLQYQSFPKNLDEMIEKVQEYYDTFDPNVNKYTWLTLHHVMTEILKAKGGNNYKIPHTGKRTQDRLGILSDTVEVNQEIIEEAVKFLNERLVVVDSQFTTHDETQELDAD